MLKKKQAKGNSKNVKRLVTIANLRISPVAFCDVVNVFPKTKAIVDSNVNLANGTA